MQHSNKQNFEQKEYKVYSIIEKNTIKSIIYNYNQGT